LAEFEGTFAEIEPDFDVRDPVHHTSSVGHAIRPPPATGDGSIRTATAIGGSLVAGSMVQSPASGVRPMPSQRSRSVRAPDGRSSETSLLRWAEARRRDDSRKISATHFGRGARPWRQRQIVMRLTLRHLAAALSLPNTTLKRRSCRPAGIFRSKRDRVTESEQRVMATLRGGLQDRFQTRGGLTHRIENSSILTLNTITVPAS
jgi:hypothetical protein